MSSKGLSALVIFIVIQLILLASCPILRAKHILNLSPGESAVQSVEDWRTRPTALLMGSSYFCVPLGALEQVNNREESSLVHKLGTFENALKLKGAAFADVRMISTGMQMMSDDYIILKQCLKDDKRPVQLILAVAPRDFYDYELKSPSDTMIFRGNASPEELPDYFRIGKLQITDLVPVIEQYFLLWQRRHNIQVKLTTALANFCPRFNSSEKSRVPEDVWAKSRRDYIKKYSGISIGRMQRQCGYFSALLRLCALRKISVLIVFIPLPSPNKQLLPPGLYSQFRQIVFNLARQNNARVLDLDGSTQFQLSDFLEYGHLNSAGGIKLRNSLVDHIYHDMQSTISQEPQAKMH